MSAGACKIILNGDTIQNVLHSVCYRIDHDDYVSVPADEAEMVGYLNEMEDLVFKFQRKFLESQGFEGPWPHSMVP